MKTRICFVQIRLLPGSPVKRPGWVLLGDGQLHSVAPVPGRARKRSQDLHATGWSCWMWCSVERALDLMRYIEEKHL